MSTNILSYIIPLLFLISGIIFGLIIKTKYNTIKGKINNTIYISKEYYKELVDYKMSYININSKSTIIPTNHVLIPKHYYKALLEYKLIYLESIPNDKAEIDNRDSRIKRVNSIIKSL